MGLIKIYIHPVFVLMCFVLIYMGLWSIFIVYIVAVVLHEIGHYAVAKMLGYNFDKVIFMPYGVGIGSHEYISSGHEVVIALAGPVVSIVIAFVVVALWWINPSTYSVTREFAEVNCIIGLFNMLPIFPLDGGRVLVGIFSNRSKKKVIKVMNTIAIVCSTICLIVFVYSIFYKINLNMLFVGCFLLSSITSSKKYDVYKYTHIIKQKKKLPLEQKVVIVEQGTNLLSLIKYIDKDKLTKFVFVDKDGIRQKTLSEIDIQKKICSTNFELEKTK